MRTKLTTFFGVLAVPSLFLSIAFGINPGWTPDFFGVGKWWTIALFFVVVAMLCWPITLLIESGFPRRSERTLKRIRDRFLTERRSCQFDGAEIRDLSDEPPLVREDDVELSQIDRDRRILSENGCDPTTALSKISQERANPPPHNDRHLILSAEQLHLNVPAIGRATDYVTVREIERLRNKRPNVLTANALLLDARRKRIGIHHRDPSNDTEKNRLHVMGGAYEPSRDVKGLHHTAEREVLEETNGILRIDTRGCLALLQFEPATNYTMVTFLGVPCEPRNSLPIKAREGVLNWYEIEQLPETLRDHEWVATGKQAVLCWLAVGAPSRNLQFPFRRGWVQNVYHRSLRSM